MAIIKEDILQELDICKIGKPSKYYPECDNNDIRYNFFLDLEHGYCDTASSKIHLYSDEIRWAIIFEKSGYQNRALAAEIELDYVGNCINYNIEMNSERKYITNSKRINLIDYDEYQKISDEEQFELISNTSNTVNIHGQIIKIEQNKDKYIELGINLRDYDNDKNLISYSDLIRFLNETNPEVIEATEDEIKSLLPNDLPKILTIKDFHFVSYYNDSLPSEQETFNLIADILVSKDISLWKPKLKSNNHWSNWESGHL